MDYELLKQRLHESIERLESNLDDAAIERVLRERGRRLAERAEAVRPEIYGTVIVARRGATLLGFPIDHVSEVRVVKVTRLPHAQRYVSGVFQLRGQLYALSDLRSFLDEHEPMTQGQITSAVLLTQRGKSLGVRVDEVIGPREIELRELDRGHRDGRLELIAEITHDCIEILDVDAFFASPHLRMEGS
jgi:chemotaxis signal transduction protein